MKPSADSAVSVTHRIAYAAPAFSLAVVGIPVYVYIPKFYTDIVGIDMIVIGQLLLAVRIFDALTDPAIGFVSDQTVTRFGRRRPYIASASFLLAISMLMLFNPPDRTPVFETWWFTIWIFCLFLFWTAVTVPYEALGPEITFDYNERTALFGTRDGFLIFGTLAAASSPALIQWLFDLSPDTAGERTRFLLISVFYAPLIILTCLWCVFVIREKSLPQRASSFNLWYDLSSVLRNGPFIILIVSYTISAFGNNLPATLILYYVQYVLQSKSADLFLAVYFLSGILFLPAWVSLSRRIGKKNAWLAAMAINTGAFAGVFFLGPGDQGLYAVLVFISGTGFGAALAIPSAIQADVIDYDELLVGQRREGRYIGLWSISKKIAAALGVGAALTVLGKSGYIPNAPQSDQVRLTLRVLYALVPCGCNLIAFTIALAYPISSTVHGEIREAVAKRHKGDTVTDPLHPDRIIL